MYAVTVYDCAGEFGSDTYGDFDSARAACLARRREHPRKVVLVFNLDRADYDTNGLTDEERDELDT